jgi:hypothetical protein
MMIRGLLVDILHLPIAQAIKPRDGVALLNVRIALHIITQKPCYSACAVHTATDAQLWRTEALLGLLSDTPDLLPLALGIARIASNKLTFVPLPTALSRRN